MLAATRHPGHAEDEDGPGGFEVQATGLIRLPPRPLGKGKVTSAYQRRCIVLHGILILKSHGFSTHDLVAVTGLSERQVRNKVALLRNLADGV